MDLKVVIAKKIVIVEDDVEVAEVYSIILEKAGYDLKIFYSEEGLSEYFLTNTPDLLIIDYKLPGRTGLEVVTSLTIDIPCLIVSGYLKDERNLLCDFLPKPINEDILIKKVNTLLK